METTETTTLSVAKMVVDALERSGFTAMYCLPGVQNDPLFDVLFEAKLTTIHTRHEQGAAYMAAGAAVVTGRPQVFCVVPGPGFLNTTAALATAYAQGAPVLALVGEIRSSAIGKDLGLVHDTPDQFGVLERLTKSAFRVTSADDAVEQVEAALLSLASGRPRPVGLEIPTDTWRLTVPRRAKAIPELLLLGRRRRDDDDSGRVLEEERIEAAAALMDEAARPLIVVGSGALDAAEEVRSLAEALQAPVCSNRNGNGVLSSEHPLAIRMPVAHGVWADVDLVIGLGTKLAQVMEWGRDDDLKVVHVDVDPREIGKCCPADVALVADLRHVLPTLLHKVNLRRQRDDDEATTTTTKRRRRESSSSSWAARVASVKAACERAYWKDIAPQMEWLDALRAGLPRDGIYVEDLCQVNFAARFAFPVYEPRTFVTTAFQNTVGAGLPMAAGAAHAAPQRPVLLVAGDGGILFTIGELATAVHFHLTNLVVVIFDNNCYGQIKLFQTMFYHSRHIACDLTNPNFADLANTFGAVGLTARSPPDLRRCLETAFSSGAGPTVVHVPVPSDFPSHWSFVLMPKLRPPSSSSSSSEGANPLETII